jgi:hypothetical protein
MLITICHIFLLLWPFKIRCLAMTGINVKVEVVAS